MMQLRQRVLIAIGASIIAFSAAAQTPAMPGPHSGSVFAAMARVKSELNLNTSQQQQWDAAVAQSKAAHQAARSSHEQVHAALQAELAKAEPDLAAVAAAGDAARQQSMDARKQARAAWLALYSSFTPEQKGVARDAIKSRMARMEAFRERMKAHHPAPAS
jgi:Spy/CpxP family protein refolding chaperone